MNGRHLQPCVGVEEEAEVAGMHHLGIHDEACSSRLGFSVSGVEWLRALSDCCARS